MWRRFLGWVATGTLLIGQAQAVTSGLWTGAWAASPGPPDARLPVGWSQQGFDNHTLRQVVRISAGGAAVRIRLSNVYGAEPLRIAGASIARSGGGAAIRPGTSRRLMFGLSRAVVIPPGGEVASDPALLHTAALESLTVSLYLAGPTGPATYHWFASATSYRAGGNRLHDTDAGAFAESSYSWYYLVGVDVLGPVLRGGAVVTLGDSITDGAYSTPDADNRYPDELAERLAAAHRPRGVLNAGIGGNRLLNDSSCFGASGLARLRRDVLDEPGVRAVIVLEGINDIRAGLSPSPCLHPNPDVTAQELIAGHREIIRRARARGLTVIGATLLPFKGDPLYDERRNQVRKELNAWMRTSGEYDAVADFDRALADPADPDRLRAEYDSGDRLHPNDAGMRAMAATIDLSML